MKQYKAVLFDLDGTLLDTIDDLADSMNAALKGLGFPTHPMSAYKYFVGDGLTTLSKRVLPKEYKTEEVISKCSNLMLEEYACRWSNKTTLYPGIADLLTKLQQQNIMLNILSNKPDAPTQKAVNFFLKSWPFVTIVGAKPNVPPKPDPTAAITIARRCNLSTSEFIYLGDTNTDMQTAVSAKMTAVGVLWGFRGRKELEESGAEIIIERPLDLLDYL